HACAAKSTAADTSSSGQDWKRVASNEECTSGSRRPQPVRPVNVDRLAVVNGAHRRTILPLPKTCPSRRAMTTLDVIGWAVRRTHVRSIVHQIPLQCRQYAPRSAQD